LIGRLRSSFASKLLLAGLVFALVVIGSVSGYLLVSRDQQTTAGALSNSDNRASVMRQVLESFTGEQSLSAARNLARQPSVIAALAGATPAASAATLLRGASIADLGDEILLLSDSRGTPIYARAASGVTIPASDAQAATGVLRDAVGGSRCRIDGQSGACGVDALAGGLPAFAVAVPVLDGTTVAGAVGYVAPLQYQLQRFSTLFQFQTVFIPADRPGTELREQNGTFVSAPAPSGVQHGIAGRSGLVHTTYDARSSSGTSRVAASFAAIAGPDGHTIAGYVGVEIPLSVFVGDERTDELTLGVITIFVLLATALAVILFVERSVRRPIRKLERGVARIASGDYTTDVEVPSKDELGSLASSVNRMRDSIASYVTEIESARSRLDSAVQRVSGVSRALTTTTGGVERLQREVARTAAEIAGSGSAAGLALLDADRLELCAAHPEASTAVSLDAASAARLLAGHAVRTTVAARPLLAVPMFYQDKVVGALVVAKPEGAGPPSEDEERVLAVLGNNTAIAMENARLFEQERETVHRLRELDAMKTDFLSTVQHELRTPLTAILGLSDLLDMCWDVWEDSPKLEAVRDIQVAGKNLYDIVETIIDFSAVDGETIGLNPSDVSVSEAISKAVEAVGERYKGGLPIPVEVEPGPPLSVYADPERFEQVLRALIDNAVKFSDGRGAVAVGARAGDAPAEVVISVADRGIGIAADDVHRIFDRFYQVDNTATRRYGGTGMGLALVKRLVQAHGATISIQTTLGEGTTFSLSWPAAASASSGEARVVAEARGDAPSRRRRPASAEMVDPVPADAG